MSCLVRVQFYGLIREPGADDAYPAIPLGARILQGVGLAALEFLPACVSH